MRSKKDAKELLEGSIDLIKDISAKIQQEASKTWQISHLKFELLGLRRKRSEKVKSLGEKVLTLTKENRIQEPALDPVMKDIADLEDHIQAKEEEIQSIEKQHKDRKAGDKPEVIVSEEKGVKEHSMAGSKSVSQEDGKEEKVNPRIQDEGDT